MGSMIEEHTEQLRNMERREQILVEREQEVKRLQEEVSLDREKSRLLQLQLQEKEKTIKVRSEQQAEEFQSKV